MNHVKFLTATLLFYFIIDHSCSQPSGFSGNVSFAATTPCNEEVKQMLNIPGGVNCEMMKWSLSLYRDDKNVPSAFDLTYKYGSPKQGTKGFREGEKTTVLKGQWAIRKAKIAGSDKNVITLTPGNASGSLSFLQASENLLHLLKEDGTPMVGDAAWSYTLNNTNPVFISTGPFLAKELPSTGIISETDTVAVFVGRTPCSESLRKLNNITAEGCQLIKCRLILLQDKKTQSPLNFVIQTIYVGMGDNKYSVTGRWKVMQGITTDPTAIIYQLLPDSPQPGNELLLLTCGDHILFFLDKNSQLLVGNDYCSYTLNREK
ncbi:MAG TPA: hypothetical protein VFP97_01375 [Chitinophagaceae bacterium]|nr:hypothetical protein [Chitinophagaceae bacterium]